MDKKKHKCPHYNDGWCYASDSNHNACPNTWSCDYFKKVVRKSLFFKKEKGDE